MTFEIGIQVHLPTFRQVTLPQLLPGIVAGGLLAFTFSFDDFIVAFFTNGRDQTLPIYLFASIRRGVTPEVNAIASVLLVVTVTAMAIVGLLLAAGSASRFGSDKLRHRLPHGVPIAVQASRHLKAEIDKIYAVVPPGSADLKALLEEERLEVVVCENAAEGMGASLACAARAAGEQGGYLVALADMPFVRRSSIAAVRDALGRGAKIVAPYFRTRRGHPVGFSASFYDDLLRLKGDEGAKSIVKRNESALMKIPLGDPGVIRDIDRPEDLMPPLAV